MISILFRWCWPGIAILLLWFAAPRQASAQEFPGFSNYLVSPADTAAILTIIRDANNIVNRYPDSALKAYRKAELLSRNCGYEDGLGYALANMGLALTSTGHFAQVMACYKEAFPYCRKSHNLPYALIHLYFNMAMSYGDKEDYQKTNEYYHKVIDLVQERMPGNHLFLISVYNNMVVVQVNMGSYAQAMKYADWAMQLAIKHDKRPQLAQIILNKGDIYWSLKQYDSALNYYNLASKYVREVNAPGLNQSYYLRMGDLLLEMNKHKEALEYLKKAKTLDDPAHPLSIIMGGYSLGDALYRLGRYQEAEAMLLDALKKAEQTGLTKNKQNGHAVLMALYKKEGRYKEAFEQLSKYQDLADSTINLEKIRSVNEIEIKYQVARKDRALLQQELMIARQGKQLYRNKIILVSIMGGILLLAAGGWAFYRYRRKIGQRDRKIEQLKAMMDGEEKERVRLSRELHDGLGGMLTGIKLSLRSIQRQQDPAMQQENLAGIMDMLQGMGEEIRQAAHNLMPDMLLKHRLKEALELYCEQLNTEEQLKIDLQCYGALHQLDVSMELQVYRIIQELMQNVVKHAQASLASIQVRYDEGVLCVSVEDNGTGFDTTQRGMGAGLSNIEARVKALNGYFSIASSPSVGTTVYVEINPGNKFLKP